MECEKKMEDKESILIVDDNESVRRTLTLIFEKSGYEIDTTGTGRDALQKAKGRFFNLAILDIRLPDMEGIELIAPLKDRHPDMSFIIITAYASLDNAVRALNRGVAAYIMKPLDMDEVLAKTREVLEKQHLVMENRRLYLAAQQELTERRRLEGELLKASKLESIGILAGGIAHDFNNFLTAILGSITLAKTYAKPGDQTFEILSAAESASIEAKSLTLQLLTFAKGGAPVKKTASIEELIKHTIDFALRGSNVRCELSLADNLWGVEIDEGQMSQVINNVIINAEQSMPEGGIIEVRAENMTSDTEKTLPLKDKRYVKISIKDQGIGISKEHLLKIFDPYFTLKSKGSGLALAISYSVVKNHQGYITAESELGKGTTFHIYLPASSKKITAKRKKAEKPLAGKGNILLMDDKEMVRKVSGKMLESVGYELTLAKDGAEAIDLYKKAKKAGRPFDAVILDLTVPGGMGGKLAIEKLLEIDPGIKAVVSSGYSNDPIMTEYRKYGFCGVVAKPYKIQELIETLYSIIARI